MPLPIAPQPGGRAGTPRSPQLRGRRPQCSARTPVFDKVGNDGRCLSVDADRQREEVEDVSRKNGDGDRNLVRRKAHADHIGRIRIELQHDARAAAAAT